MKRLSTFGRVLAWLLPRACLVCKKTLQEADFVCMRCKNTLPCIQHACIRCALPLYADESHLCGDCLQHAPPYDRLFALFHYAPPMTEWIHRLKFYEGFCEARAMSAYMLEAIKRDWYPEGNLPQLLIPVPLNPVRLRTRGFNQAVELAKPLARRLKLPLETHRVRRIINTLAQSSLPSKKRQANLRGAFEVALPLQGLHIALIDDVVTTGATVSTLARACKKQGAQRIDVWCVARTARK